MTQFNMRLDDEGSGRCFTRTVSKFKYTLEHYSLRPRKTLGLHRCNHSFNVNNTQLRSVNKRRKEKYEIGWCSINIEMRPLWVKGDSSWRMLPVDVEFIYPRRLWPDGGECDQREQQVPARETCFFKEEFYREASLRHQNRHSIWIVIVSFSLIWCYQNWNDIKFL